MRAKTKEMSDEQLAECARTRMLNKDYANAAWLWDMAADRTVDSIRNMDWRGNAIMCRKEGR